MHTHLERSTHNSGLGFDSHLTDPWNSIMFNWHVIGEDGFADEFKNVARDEIGRAKRIITKDSYDRALTFLEFIVREKRCPREFAGELNNALRASRAAYRIIEQNVVPVASDEEGRVLATAFEILRGGRFPGARAHLAEAAQQLKAGNSAASVRESISAVESVAKVLEPGATTLGPALTALERGGAIHGGIKSGFSALYGFTSDEQGIRHALLEKDEAAIDDADAIYMLGACAAFVTYLALKTEPSA